jgi:hypothetical protein
VKLLGRLQAGTARILSATVSTTAGRWYVSFTCQAEREPAPRNGNAAQAVGVSRHPGLRPGRALYGR